MLQVVNKAILAGLISSASHLHRFLMQHIQCCCCCCCYYYYYHQQHHHIIIVILSLHCVSVQHLFVRPDLVYVKPFGYKMKLRIVIMPIIVDVQRVHRTQWLDVLVSVCVCVCTKFHALSHSLSLLNVCQGES